MNDLYPKEFYIKMLHLVVFLNSEHKANPKKFFYKKEIEKYGGCYSRPICKILSEKVIFNVAYIKLLDNGTITDDIEDLEPVIVLCRTKLSEIDKREEERILEIKTKNATIMYSKFAVVLSAISITLTLLFAIGIIG